MPSIWSWREGYSGSGGRDRSWAIARTARSIGTADQELGSTVVAGFGPEVDPGKLTIQFAGPAQGDSVGSQGEIVGGDTERPRANDGVDRSAGTDEERTHDGSQRDRQREFGEHDPPPSAPCAQTWGPRT